ncbi:MAG: aldo/keto reductase [Chloroflexi bacterium]|nr:aldo/keto reductase [Chloroflexota bacterium]
MKSNKTLETIAKAHNATIFQIALAWAVSHPRVITIPMSFNPAHIKENFEAAEIELTEEELGRM